MTSWGSAAIGGYKERIEEARHPAVEEEVQWDIFVEFCGIISQYNGHDLYLLLKHLFPICKLSRALWPSTAQGVTPTELKGQCVPQLL